LGGYKARLVDWGVGQGSKWCVQKVIEYLMANRIPIRLLQAIEYYSSPNRIGIFGHLKANKKRDVDILVDIFNTTVHLWLYDTLGERSA